MREKRRTSWCKGLYVAIYGSSLTKISKDCRIFLLILATGQSKIECFLAKGGAAGSGPVA
jgi:hypothetical protein